MGTTFRESYLHASILNGLANSGAQAAKKTGRGKQTNVFAPMARAPQTDQRQTLFGN